MGSSHSHVLLSSLHLLPNCWYPNAVLGLLSAISSLQIFQLNRLQEYVDRALHGLILSE